MGDLAPLLSFDKVANLMEVDAVLGSETGSGVSADLEDGGHDRVDTNALVALSAPGTRYLSRREDSIWRRAQGPLYEPTR